MLLAENKTYPQADDQSVTILIRNFIQAHLSSMFKGRRFSTEEHIYLQEVLVDGDEGMLAAYEVFSLNNNEDDLLETLKLLCQIDLEENMEYGSPLHAHGNDSKSNVESKKSEYQRDSWPSGFEKLVDKTKATKILEEFKDIMSSVKYSILQKVI